MSKEEPKYALVHADLNKLFLHKADNDRPRMTGLFGWVDCMEGDLRSIDEDISDYDILHVNLCTATLGFPGRIKQLGYKGRVIANLDYDMDMLPGHGGIKNFINALNEADYIFGVSHSQIAGIQHLVSKVIHKINHPCDLKHLLPMRTELKDRVGIGVMLHGKYRQPGHTVTTATERFVGKEPVFLYNAAGNLDQEALSVAFLPMPFKPYVNNLRFNKIGVDGHRDIAWGRYQLDCAALGIPCVGPSTVENQEVLFPALTVKNHADFEKMDELIERLLTDLDFYNDCVKYADGVLDSFGYDKCKEDMLRVVRWEQ